jgi:hypothetical protein
MICTVDLAKWGLEERDHHVFYATHDYILYKEGQFVRLADCSGQIITEEQCPFDYRQFDCVEFPDCIVLLIGGRHVMMLDKDGMKSVHHEIDVTKYGRIVTGIHATPNENIVFGTVANDKCQFIIYDFASGNRVAQSPSWKSNVINALLVSGNLLYGLLSQSFFVACNLKTGENVWKKFETATTKSSIQVIDDRLIYASEGVIKTLRNGKASVTSVPTILPKSVEAVIKERIILTSGTQVSCFNTRTDHLDWELKTKEPIAESIRVRGKTVNGNVNAIISRSNSQILAIDVDAGRIMQAHQTTGGYKLHASHDHVILNRSNEQTTLIPGVRPK